MDPELKDAIAAYYRRDFPADALHAFFAVAHERQSGSALDCREWGVETVEGVFLRWLHCSSPEELVRLVTRSGTGKLNVGAVYGCSVAQRKRRQAAGMHPVQREFVVDIDLDDYGDVGKDDLEGCDRHWPVVAIGLTAVRKVLETAFGFRHFLVVYSGRRGGHLWVCDRRARVMDNEKRASVVAFLQGAMRAGAQSSGEPGAAPSFDWVRDHPSLKELVAHSVCFFENRGVRAASAGGVGMLDEAHRRDDFLASIDAALHARLRDTVRAKSGRAAQVTIKEYVRRNDGNQLRRRYEDAVMTLVFPRLDINVSTHMGHMLKAPFSVHPKTGRVSVPLPLECDVTAWRPEIGAPDVQRLRMHETNDVDKLARAVQVLRDMTETIRTSDSEAWQFDVAEGLQRPPAKRPRVISFVGGGGAGAVANGVAIIAPHDRVCWQLKRVLTVLRHADEPNDVVVEMCTRKSAVNFVRLVKAGQFPPFVHDERDVERRLEKLLGAVLACARAPTSPQTGPVSYHGEIKHFVQMVKDATVEAAEDRFERLALELDTPKEVARVRCSWGREAVMTTLRLTLVPVLERELQSL